MNDDKTHIASAYDRDLEALQASVVRMGGLVEVAITTAIKALITLDLEKAEAVRKGDQQIDALEEEINDNAARIIALRAPMGNDLRVILSIIKISSSLERMGDYAKNICKRAPILEQSAPIKDTQNALERMGKEVQGMLSDGLDAHIRHDAKLAENVRERDYEVDQMYNSLFREFLTHMMEDPRNITACMHLHFIAKNLERMGDHVTSIAEEVIYLVTGERPDEDRQKPDQTPFSSSS